MAVVPAGVHPTGNLAGMRQAGCLLHRQRVHVGAQADRVLAVAVAQNADDAGLADAAMHLDPPFLQLARDELRGAVLGHAEFRMRVDIAPDVGEFGMGGAGVLKQDWA